MIAASISDADRTTAADACPPVFLAAQEIVAPLRAEGRCGLLFLAAVVE
jgi:hypothetical protein